MNGKPMQPKIIAFDANLPQGYIKVMSRTLFVGGANGSQAEIQSLFERFGQVQTCIANRDKRHAFVKMTTRSYALEAKQNMEEMQSRNDRDVMNIARQTKWGVGFGPRECCDYAKGESVIPIDKLTDADTKWLLTAEYGGTGGRTIESGMVLEEPDIEIGAGVSSKAMSKRVGPDMSGQQSKRQRDDRNGGGGGGGGGRHGGGGNHNNHRNKGGDHGYGGNGNGQQPVNPYSYARPEPVAVATPPAVPGFGFSLGGLQGGSGAAYR
jgi:protein NRD1